MSKVDQKLSKRKRYTYEEHEESILYARKQDRSKQRRERQVEKVSHCETSGEDYE